MEVRFPLILDGAMGTELQKRGFDGGDCAERWTIEHPEALLEIQRGYVAAGSQILYAPTFGANRVKLEAHGIFNRVADYNKRLAALSKQAAEGKALVAGDLSPTGLFLYPLGDTRFEELVEIYTEQAKALEEAGVDLFVIETMMGVAECRAALLAVKSVSRKPVFVTVTCDTNGRTLSGSDAAAVLQILQGMGVDAFGLNCSAGPDEMLPTLRRLREISRVPLIAKPNAGMPEITDTGAVYSCTPEDFAARLEDFAAAGVMIFGGCCGTTAEHIRAVAEKAGTLRMCPPAPVENGLLPCATEKELCFLDPAVPVGEALACDGELEDRLEEAMGEDTPLVTVEIRTEAELENFADAQFLITKPLCLRASDASLLEQALRLYQGRALYDGPLSEDVLAGLAKKYGLIY